MDDTISAALYKPQDYPVFVGNGTDKALCTAWNDTDSVLRAYPKSADHFAIIGTLRGPSGIAPIIRNLALNPKIRQVHVWPHGPLSRTETGRSGTDILSALWRGGIADDGTVPGTTYQLEPEIPPEFVRELIRHVELVQVAGDAIFCFSPDPPEPVLAAPRSFPEPAGSKGERWPAEQVGMSLRGRSLVEVWTKLVTAIMRYGVRKGTQFGMRQAELTAVSWTISGEAADGIAFPDDWPGALRRLTGTLPEMLADYLPQIMTGELGESTYGALLRRYPTANGPLDQIAKSLIGGLKSSPDCRRGVATTLIPERHAGASDPPCLNLLQALSADGLVNLVAYLRSHDIMKGALPNAFALRRMQKEIADAVGLAPGALTILSASAHIYEQDWVQAERLIDCAQGREVSAVFASEDADPRGNLLIAAVDGKIRLRLANGQGQILWSGEYRTAKIAAANLAHAGIFVDPKHLLYIGMELSRAEAALRNGSEYAQS